MRFRRRRNRREAELSLRPISNWMLLIVVMAVAVVGGGLTWWLLSIAGAAGPSVQIDAIRTGLSAAVGTGGAFALLLAFRRQRSTEVSAVHTITDATERRVTELYTKAADQLGSDKAAVRLAGLYALERLAQDNPSQRQTIVYVICAYLQMPYTPPGASPAEPSLGAGTDVEDEKRAEQERERYEKRLQEHEKRAQEHRVRTTALRILWRHVSLSADRETIRWKAQHIDLTGAYLAEGSFVGMDLTNAIFLQADLTEAQLVMADLTGAHLVEANLTGAELVEVNLTGANLRMADLTGAELNRADLTGADLRWVNLTGAHLVEANLTGAHLFEANLTGAELVEVNLTGAELVEVNLTGAHLGRADLTGAFLGGASWTEDTAWPSDLRDTIKAASAAADDAAGGFCVQKGYRVPGLLVPGSTPPPT